MQQKRIYATLGIALIGIGLAYFFKKDASSSIESPIESANPASPEETTTHSQAPSSSLTKPQPQVSTMNTGTTARQTEFKKLIDETWSHIPTIADLRALSSEEVHHTPPVILQTGARLGEIAESLKDHPELLPDAVRFYRDCARNAEFPNSIRALCFNDLTKKSPGTAEGDENDPQISDDVKRLSAAIGSK